MEYLDTLRGNLARLSEADRAFAQSLLDQAGGRGLSAKQAAWAAKLSARAQAPEPEPVGGLGAIVELLQRAGQTLKYPKITVQAGDLDLRLSIAGARSRAPGSVNVTCTTRSFDDRTYYGRIGRDGVFAPSLNLAPETRSAIVAALQSLANDPAQAAAAYGRRTGACCFCNLALSDAGSVASGYGKTCAKKYGLPWGLAK